MDWRRLGSRMAPNSSGRGRHQKIMSWVKSLLTTEQKHFIIVGLVNTILSYALFSVLLYFQLSYVLSYWISMCAGVLNSYILNKFLFICENTKNMKNFEIGQCNNEKLLVNFLKQKTFVMKCKHI